MIHRVLRYGRWVIDALFAYPENDADGVLGCLYDTGAPASVVDRAKDIISGGLNRGFTYANYDTRRIIAWIGQQSDGPEWVNTTVHEIVHVASAIAKESDMDHTGEQFAYLIGDLVQDLADIICFLACDRCRDNADLEYKKI